MKALQKMIIHLQSQSPEKLFSLSSYLSFCLDFLVMKKNGLIRKARLISKFMASQPGSQTFLIHLLPNISRSKGNQTIKFCQLIECNKRNTFVEKPYKKCYGETIARPFSKKNTLIISLYQ